MCRVHLPLDPLLCVYTSSAEESSAGASTIPLQTPKSKSQWFVGRFAVNVHIMGVLGCLIWRTTGSLKDLLTHADPYRRTRCGGETRVILFLSLIQTPKLKADVRRGAKCCLSANTMGPFATFIVPVTPLCLERDYFRN